MVQLATLITAVLTGTRSSTWNRASRTVLAVFAATLCIQTPLVASEGGLDTATDITIYVVAHIATILIGLGVARLLLRRRTSTSAA